MIKKIIHAFTMLIIAFCNAQTGKVGIGTSTPTNTLHVKSTADPLRLEGVQQAGNTLDALLAKDSDGVVKKLQGNNPSSTSLVLDVLGTGSSTYGGTGTWVDNTYTNALLNTTPTVDTYTGFSHGPNFADNYYTVKADGLYVIKYACFIQVSYTNYSTLDYNGMYGIFNINIKVNGTDISNLERIIFRGAKDNPYNIITNTTVWLKNGDKVEFKFKTNNTDKMYVTGKSNLLMKWDNTRVIMYKML